MKGRDITQMKGWGKLAAQGWVPVKFKGQMGYYEVGAALPIPGTTTTDDRGRRVWVEAATIEPSGATLRDRNGKRIPQWILSVRADLWLQWHSGRTIIRAALDRDPKAEHTTY